MTGGGSALRVQAVIDQHYSIDCQISRGQAYVIAATVASCGARPNLLVFGCGNDSSMWAAANPAGRTLFVENHPAWLERMREEHPTLEIEEIDYKGRRVDQSLPLIEDDLRKFPVPAILQSSTWDVILVDSPMGSKPHMPGRSLSIYWSSLVAAPATHVFVDDYRRGIEKTYADHFFRSRRPWNIEVPRVFRHGIPNAGVMLWSLGISA